METRVIYRASLAGTSRVVPETRLTIELRMSWAPAKNRIKERAAVAMVSALPCPQGCPASAGWEMTTDTKRDIRAISTSTDESIPSPRTARLPECIPTPILRTARQRFPVKAVMAAVFMIPALPAVPGTDKVDSDKRGITPYKRSDFKTGRHT
jgi:hypothetical protein